MINHPRRSRVKAPTPTASATHAGPMHTHPGDFDALREAVAHRFSEMSGPLFTTNAADLFDLYLRHLPSEHAVHTCTECRKFVTTYGGLVGIGPDGHTMSAFWSPPLAPTFYRPAIAAMQKEVLRARVTGPFLSPDPQWGVPHTRPNWTHFAVTPPRALIFRPTGLLTASQAVAARREDFRTVATALTTFTPAILTEALRLLSTDTLTRSERFTAPIQWLLDLHTAQARVRDGRRREAILWAAIASAPEGYCHPRASMTGSLLEDIAAGLPFPDVKARWEAKMHPLAYQRPQAAPTAGAIASAERAFEALGLAPALERRHARVDEVEAIWRPTPPRAHAAASTGTFGHLAPKGAAADHASLSLPPVTMTWAKFDRTVLPTSLSLRALIPSHGPFIGLTTAAVPYAPPLIRWDHPDAPNPFSWYCYTNGSPARQWSLTPGWADVTAVVPLPCLWGPDPSPHLAEGVILTLANARDISNTSNCLFPEHIRPDLHAYRAVIEAYSRRARLGPAGGPDASGLDIRKGSSTPVTLSATTPHGTLTYRIDRWD